jgi:flagellar hook-basal body complex protein FliE
MRIEPITPITAAPVQPTGVASAGDQGQDFAQMLMDAIKDVNAMQSESRQLATDLMTGRQPVELHDLMIAMEKASTAMQLTMSVRNKMLEAYQEVSRIQV